MKRKLVLETGQNLWFTSDTHYSHTNFVFGESQWENKKKTRKFATAEEMNDLIVENINSLVGEGDVLYHLGDFAFKSEEQVERFRSRIACRNLHLVLGNHDHRIEGSERLRSLFSSVDDYVELSVFEGSAFANFVLMHYPLSSWRGMHRGHIHLHGHLHSDPDMRVWEGSMDVGMDGNGMKPVGLKEVLGLFSDPPVYF